MPKRKLVKEADGGDGDLQLTNGVLDPAEVVDVLVPPSKKRKVKASNEQVLVTEEPQVEVKKAKKRGKKTTSTNEWSAAEGIIKDVPVKVPRKRKTKEEKEAEAMPLTARTIGHKLFIGAHVSSSGGVHNSVSNSVHIGANAFALFLKSQRKWANPALAEDTCASFHTGCSSHAYDQSKHVVPHGSYLVNLAHTDQARTDQAYASFLDDLQRCERLGIRLYNFHPGVANSVGEDRQKAIQHLAANINRAHKATSTVITLLENMAHGGNTLGSTFEDLRDTIALVEDKKRVGVCLDTCHAFAGGYDLRTPAAFQATMSLFEEVVGGQYLRAVHMNDSKAPFASHKDLHANIGTGFLGLRAFHNIVNDARFEGLPLILETPTEDAGTWAREIKLLESLVGMDVKSKEFVEMESHLASKGEAERLRINDQVERKKDKDAAKAMRAANEGKTKTRTKKKEKEKEKEKKRDDAPQDENEDEELSELDSDVAEDELD